MELLIPGLLLVALMVWASTKIKRNAAAAFEAETVETDEFVIAKPDGFLHVVNDDSGLAFRAYSKEYGSGDLNGQRQATIGLEAHENKDLDSRFGEIEDEMNEITDVQNYLDGGERAVTFSADAETGEAKRVHFIKLVPRGKKVFELRFAVLADHKDDYMSKAEDVLTGFRAK